MWSGFEGNQCLLAGPKTYAAVCGVTHLLRVYFRQKTFTDPVNTGGFMVAGPIWHFKGIAAMWGDYYCVPPESSKSRMMPLSRLSVNRDAMA